MKDNRKTNWEGDDPCHDGHKKILLHIPHSSILFPADSHHSFWDLDDEERLLIDYFTDELFIPDDKTENISYVVFPYCRLYCDVERLINDPLVEVGLGISYERMVATHRGYSIRSFSTRQDAFNHYVDHHALVSKQLYAMDRNTLIIDCHSFSSLPNLLNSNPPDIDICIGFNDDETCPDKVVIGNIVQHFMSYGYKVGMNEPFSNSKTFAVPTNYHSVMIEVNKRLYMNEQSIEKTEGYDKLRNDIQSLFEILLKK